MFLLAIFCTWTHLVNIDGNADDDVQQVSERQAGDQDVGPVPHALILIDDSQQSGIANNAHNKHQARHHRVNVLERVSDFRGPGAHGRQPAAGEAVVGPHRTLHVPLYEPDSLGNSKRVPGHLILCPQLPTGHKDVTGQEE